MKMYHILNFCSILFTFLSFLDTKLSYLVTFSIKQKSSIINFDHEGPLFKTIDYIFNFLYLLILVYHGCQILYCG